MLNTVKTWLKTNQNFYKISKSFRDSFLSIPYILQALKPKPHEKNVMLGCSQRVEGWISFDIAPGGNYLGDIRNLSVFKNDSINKVYASHVLEHISCKDAQVALKEMYRILKPGGEVFLAVPDMLIISKLLETEFAETAMDVIFGVNRPVKDWHPQHMYGYTKSLLRKLMEEIDFISIQDFEPFIQDTTQFYVGHIKISICFTGKKPYEK